ncbi:MAG: type I restriction endonuclease subunit R [Acidobacteria bacterium]|nr:MAG: type I restriction endonuclease subunit R [Acidobacteriota bacterium]
MLRRDELRAAIRRINLRDGEPWLDEGRISQAASALERIGSKRLIEANEAATRLLHDGVAVEGLPGWDGGRARTVHYVDWEHPEKNVFTAVSQFRVDCPGGRGRGFIVPDVVLFVNGIPVVVVECKSPTRSEPIPSAVDQLRRYHNARRAAGEVSGNEGNERLFYTNQILIATCYDEARAGTLHADAGDYVEWKDTAPVPRAEVLAELGRTRLSSQHTLVAGLLRPAHLLDVLRHFTLFKEGGGRKVKIVCRYQQFRAVHYAIDRLLHGKTRRQDGEHDRRGGIIWHTQGSGKSLTMVFLVRKIRSIPALRRFKVVIVTDRKDLERQLRATARLTGESLQVAKSVSDVHRLLRRRGPEIVFAMIQKYSERDLEGYPPPVAAASRLVPGEPVHLADEISDRRPAWGEELSAAAEPRPAYDPGPGPAGVPTLNDDEAILALVDEAHRSHGSSLHANLLQALPNCARIGFTGTPIIMGAKKRTHEIFGDFIDRYTLRQSEADGVTVPILYEGRTAEAAVSDGRDLDHLFEDLVAGRDPKQLEALERKYGTRGAIFEAPKLIRAKAEDMLFHYVENILPSGLKAQVVCCSRRAAVRYQQAFVAARDALVRRARDLDPETRALDDVALDGKPRALRAAVRAGRDLALLERLEFAAVISPAHNDPPEWSEWSDPGRIETRIERFKRPLLPDDGGAEPDADPLAFLIVKSMLLTGFDAPIEGVAYLDRPIKEAELLQAIARVNRTGYGKRAGIVVDYFGIARHLTEALAAYSAEDVAGTLQSLRDEIPKLRDRYDRVVALFQARQVEPTADVEEAVALLEDVRLRAEFAVKLKRFLATLDLVLPRPEGLPFVRPAATLGEIYHRARHRYREGLPVIGKALGRKVKRLIDEHVLSLGIDPKIPPLAITDDSFGRHVGRQVSERAKASEMEHALRHHLRRKLAEDPVRYRKLSERLEEILARLKENWSQQVLELGALIEEAKRERQAVAIEEVDLEPHQLPFYDLLAEERRHESPVAGADAAWLAELTVEMVERLIREEVGMVGFWHNPSHQEALRSRIFIFLDENEIVPFERADAVADRVMEVAKANHDRLVHA